MERLSFWQKLIKILFDPRQAFEKMETKPFEAGLILIVYLAARAMQSTFDLPYIFQGFDFQYLLVLNALGVGLMAWLFLSFFYHAVQWLAGANGSFAQLLLLMAYASLPLALIHLFLSFILAVFPQMGWVTRQLLQIGLEAIGMLWTWQGALAYFAMARSHDSSAKTRRYLLAFVNLCVVAFISYSFLATRGFY